MKEKIAAYSMSDGITYIGNVRLDIETEKIELSNFAAINNQDLVRLGNIDSIIERASIHYFAANKVTDIPLTINPSQVAVFYDLGTKEELEKRANYQDVSGEMNEEGNLENNILNHPSDAKNPQEKRTNLMEAIEQNIYLIAKIQEVVSNELIPSISANLPPGYTINDEKTSICGSGDIQEMVSSDFKVSLQICYNELPVCCGSKGHKDLEKVQKTLKPKLEEFAKKYDLDRVIIVGKQK